MHRLLAAIALAVLFGPRCSAAQHTPLTLDGALAIARQHAPVAQVARTRADEARSQLIGASRLLPDNPLVELAGGRRLAEPEDFTEVDAAVSQPIDLWGRRSSRIAAAEAHIAGSEANGADTLRHLLRDVATVFLETLAAQERVRLATEAEQVARDQQASTARRFELGDVSVLDLNLATIAAARAATARLAAQAELIAGLGQLRILLGLNQDEPLAVGGVVLDRRRYELDTLLSRAGDRPDLQALIAELREVDAELRLARSQAFPDVAVGASYERDEGDNVFLGGVKLSLPLFARGQDLRAAALARQQRLHVEADASRRALAVEVHTAFENYQTRLAAVEVLDREALPHLGDNDSLAQRSYEAGQLRLPELLLLRRETFEIRRLYLDQQLLAALAGIELEASAGVLR